MNLLPGAVIFFSVDKKELFDSTYDDDVWEINLKGIEIFEDPSMRHPMYYTTEKIPKNKIKLIHKGTGEDNF